MQITCNIPQEMRAQTSPRMSNYAKQLLGSWNRGTVHSVFGSSLNLIFEGRLLHLAAAEASLVSFGICVDTKVLAQALASCRVGDMAVYQKQQLMLYSRSGILTFPLDAAFEVDMQVKRSTVKPCDLEGTALFEQLQSLPFERNCGLGFALDSGDAWCIRALAENRTDEWQQAAARLLGRGLGLTPAGDDFLYGYTLAKLRYGAARSWIAVMDALDWRKTTTISTAYYRALRRGYSSEDWLRLCAQDTRPRGPDMNKALWKVLDCGHTSGYDTVLGFTTGMQSVSFKEE
jgi:hypothetical protein